MISKVQVPGLLVVTSVVLIVAGALWLITAPAAAQCEEPPPSSCSSCHALEHPVSTEGEWHQIHCRQDICLNCHGGNGSTMDQELAHAGMNAQPLSDIYTDCHSCHPDYDERAGRFAAAAGVAPGSCATPTPVAVDSGPAEPQAGSPEITSSRAEVLSTVESAGLTVGALGMMAFFLLSIKWLDGHSTERR